MLINFVARHKVKGVHSLWFLLDISDVAFKHFVGYENAEIVWLAMRCSDGRALLHFYSNIKRHGLNVPDMRD